MKNCVKVFVLPSFGLFPKDLVSYFKLKMSLESFLTVMSVPSELEDKFVLFSANLLGNLKFSISSEEDFLKNLKVWRRYYLTFWMRPTVPDNVREQVVLQVKLINTTICHTYGFDVETYLKNHENDNAIETYFGLVEKLIKRIVKSRKEAGYVEKGG